MPVQLDFRKPIKNLNIRPITTTICKIRPRFDVTPEAVRSNKTKNNSGSKTIDHTYTRLSKDILTAWDLPSTRLPSLGRLTWSVLVSRIRGALQLKES